VLIADGDRMGKLLNRIADEDGHCAVSTALSDFAAEAKEIVIAHRGHPVYTGGDDVLALLPVNRALDCAAALANSFRALMLATTRTLNVALTGSDDGGTLSVGIALVHFLDPLLVSLDRAREAEKAAKKERNSLAVALHTRGGEPLTVPQPWNSPADVAEWKTLTRALTGNDLARGFPYELRALAREWRGTELPAAAMRAEAMRILKRKKGGDASESDHVAILRQRLRPDSPSGMAGSAETPAPPPIQNADELEDFARKLVIARFLAEYEPRVEVVSAEAQNVGKEGRDG
jgi:CRISPR-associated protein Cmr2